MFHLSQELGEQEQLKRKLLHNNMEESFDYHEDSIVCTNTDQVFVKLEQTGIPTQLIAKLPVLNPITFGVKDLHKNSIFYLHVDEIIEFYNIEYDRIINDEEIPEEIKNKLLRNFFLFRKVKRDTINKEEERINV